MHGIGSKKEKVSRYNRSQLTIVSLLQNLSYSKPFLHNYANALYSISFYRWFDCSTPLGHCALLGKQTARN